MREGFTLAELLIALVILGVIATFTIPKVLTSQQDAKYNAMAKESAAMMSGAYEAYKQQNTANAGTSMNELTPFMNYVRINTSTLVDDVPGFTSVDCTNVNRGCLLLHNGGTFWYRKDRSFGNTAATNAVFTGFDPDSVYSGDTVGPVKAVSFFIYFNGRVTTRGGMDPNTYSSNGLQTFCPTCDPPWFGWN